MKLVKNNWGDEFQINLYALKQVESGREFTVLLNGVW